MKERELPEGWVWKCLGDVISYQKGKKPENLVNDPSGFVYLTTEYLRFGRAAHYISEMDVPDCVFSNDDNLLIIWDGSNSGDVFLGKVGIVASTMAKIELVKDDLSQKYIFYYLRSKFDMFNGNTTGSSIPHLNKNLFEKLRIPIPPLPTQRKIVAILERAEHLRCLRAAADALTQQLVQSVFLEMFGDPLSNSYNWMRCSIGEILSESPQNGIYKSSNFYGEGTPILRIDSFYDGKISDMYNLKRLNCSDDEVVKYCLNIGDILINRVNSLDYLGKCGLVEILPEPTVFESNLMRLKVNSEIVNPNYLTAFLCTQYVRTQILSKAKKAVNQASINQEDVKSLEILLPPLDLQNKYAQFVRSSGFLRDKMTHSRENNTDLMNCLISRAFTGELIA